MFRLELLEAVILKLTLARRVIFLALQLQLSLRYQSLDCRLFVGFILLIFVLRGCGHLLLYILWRRGNDSESIHRFGHAFSYVGQHGIEPLSPFFQFLL